MAGAAQDVGGVALVAGDVAVRCGGHRVDRGTRSELLRLVGAVAAADDRRAGTVAAWQARSAVADAERGEDDQGAGGEGAGPSHSRCGGEMTVAQFYAYLNSTYA